MKVKVLVIGKDGQLGLSIKYAISGLETNYQFFFINKKGSRLKQQGRYS